MRHSHPTRLDHLVVAAHSLEAGVAYIQKELGVTLPFGGVHPTMGTHNHLAQIGEDCFLEIISPNPEAAPPVHPRWFGLDSPQMLQRLHQQPRLVTWVVNTTDILHLAARAAYPCGTPTPVTRGQLSWMFSLPLDGALIENGVLPNIIEWKTAQHPAKAMNDVGIRLKSLTLHHPDPTWLSEMLESIHAGSLVSIKATPTCPPWLEAAFDTVRGEVTLSSY